MFPEAGGWSDGNDIQEHQWGVAAGLLSYSGGDKALTVSGSGSPPRGRRKEATPVLQQRRRDAGLRGV